jgi:hypothetical protein
MVLVDKYLKRAGILLRLVKVGEVFKKLYRERENDRYNKWTLVFFNLLLT